MKDVVAELQAVPMPTNLSTAERGVDLISRSR
jgi:hypothetical protein